MGLWSSGPVDATLRAMPQRSVELILMRQLAATLAVPMLLADHQGDMLFFNEPAEVLLGQRFDDVGDMPLERRSAIFSFRDESGEPLTGDPPLMVAIKERRPVHRRIWLRGFDGRDRALEATALPLETAEGRVVGGLVMFWERKRR
jgi:PAS domain-containing protein